MAAHSAAMTMRTLELKIPPMALALATGLLMWFGARTGNIFSFESPTLSIAAAGLVGAGISVMILGVRAFRQARTTVNPMNPGAASALVISGIYRWTRNPMYLGALLVLLGWAIYLGNVLSFLFLPAFVVYLNRFQIIPEEAALTARFGPEFAAYQARVRRWI